MPLNEELRSRIEATIAENKVLLFMKGTPAQPQCGFSATVIGILNNLVPDYETINVLENPEVREGIKEFSQWPTIPQLYVEGEFVGGCDVVQQMYATGELHRTFGLEAPELVVPEVSISDAAAEAIRQVQAQNNGAPVHLKIDAGFKHEFSLAPAKGHEVAVTANGIEILMDPDSARRADGLELDMAEGPQGGGFSIANPNAPPPVAQMTVAELKAKLDAGEPVALYDVREEHETATARIEGATRLDEDAVRAIDALPRDALLVFHCHSGVRSQQAAEYFRQQGFTNVHNLAGGIDAWSQEIDPSVPRY